MLQVAFWSFICAACSASSITSADRSSFSPVDVCDVVDAPSKYNGQLVALRGTLKTGMEEMALYGDACKRTLTTHGHRWPAAIWLTPNPGSDAKAERRLDRPAIEHLNAAIRVARTQKAEIQATFVGILEARSKYFGGTSPNGDWIGNGFGHLNAYPAQLVFTTVRDVSIVRKPAP